MSNFFGGKKGPVNNPTPPETALRVQSSIQGKPRPIGWGQGRVAGNAIWYGNFQSISHYTQSGGGGGKGGGNPNANVNVSYTYQVGVAFGLCEGPITSILSVWNNKTNQSLASLNLTAFLGSYSQTAWGYLAAVAPASALAFRGLAYVGAGPFDLGSSSSLPNLSFEVKFAIADAIAGQPDADPRDVVVDALTSVHYGVGYPSGGLGTLDVFSSYCRATGMVVSPILTDQQAANQLISNLLTGLNCEAVMSGGVLDIVPRGDQTITANGATYTAPAAPEYDLTESDFLPGNGSDPTVKIKRNAQQDRLNAVSVEYLDRSNNYNPVAIDAKDDASIAAFGQRPSALETRHYFATGAAAQQSAQLELGRQQIANTYEFKLPARFVRLDPMDIVTLTRLPQGLARQWARIVKIAENSDRTLSMTAEDYLGGTGAAPIYGRQATTGYVPDYNVDPGGINDPVLFEPTDQLAGGLEVWAAISGQNTALWGGADIYLSYDNTTYQLSGQVVGPARTGYLTAPLASVAVNPTGVTIDQTNTLSVNLAESAGALTGGTLADVLAYNTLCYVDGELVAYRDALLTSASHYDLSYLARGIYGTEDSIATHASGTRFARLDQGVFKFPYDQSRIGSTVYIKFCSFNIWGGGRQQLSDVGAYSYVITGRALTSPLPVVANPRVVFKDNFMEIWWDDLTDFRTGIRYKIYKGDSFAGAQQVGDNAHPPFIAFGTGTYWIQGYAQPVADLYVYSDTPTSIEVAGNMLVKNLVYQSDQKAAGWPGIFSNGVGIDGGNIRLGGSGNILAETDFLNVSDVLNYGGVISSGTYEIAPADYVNVGYLADCYVNASWQCVGSPVGQNILTVDDFLAMPDVLGSASTQYVNVKVQIATAQSAAPGDLYAAGDLYAVTPDLYGYGVVWSDWQDFVPGVYRAWLIKFRLVLTTIDGKTICFCLAFDYQASVLPRIDHYPDLTVPAGGLTITFEPDDASAPSPFNGGPPVGGVANQPLPFVNISWVNQPGLTPVVDALTLAHLVFHFEDAAHTPTQVDSSNVQVEGF